VKADPVVVQAKADPVVVQVKDVLAVLTARQCGLPC